MIPPLIASEDQVQTFGGTGTYRNLAEKDNLIVSQALNPNWPITKHSHCITAPKVVMKQGPHRNVKLEMEVLLKRHLALTGKNHRPSVDSLEDEKEGVGEWSTFFPRKLGIIVKQ
ncbi:hypothetical protein ACH5RR_006765 [Cinchona calisaya]|uniref:Uncharacterized protein n=1 Tax=Cinchona calisaya TaxID=153742 RepID=A0ABD3AQ02_9GENT